MITLAALTVARSDFGRMQALYEALHRSDRYRLLLAAGAGHHDERLGRTLSDVERSGLPLDCVLPPVEGGPGAQSAAVLVGMVEWLERRRPDALLILGDRYEMLAGAQAAMLARVPIVHIGGGHLTLGAMDERVRHALSKLSALHLVASDACGARVAALHEDPGVIHVTGAPELDALVLTTVIPRDEFCRALGLNAGKPIALVTLHPETNVTDAENAHFAAEAERALMAMPQQVLITAPCADPGNEPFLALCESLPLRRPDSCYVPNLGLRRYVAALHHADVVLGNSSSGIIEAATAGAPVVNVGERQALRDRAENVLDCPFDADAILNAVNAATEPDFVARSRNVVNPYGDGTFVARVLPIFDGLSWPLPVDKPWLP
ncbi:MAG: UDP-N-acetylglucosamine 2-epimerase [Pandoraea sp.]|nr:UDP-N-acetylglucosamine 2-epimerase [Pandoraea sp.]MDR3399312.1 UDP-N-acetylglucosamine 2-epimerase [Pandoraea sp.]